MRFQTTDAAELNIENRPANVARRETSLPQSDSSRMLVIAAFAAVYVVWGANYLANRYALETIPPLSAGGARFFIAGLMLYVVLRFRGAPSATGTHLKHAALAGSLMLGIGNGGLNWAQQRIPSCVTALLIAVTPLWFVLLEWLRPNGTRPTRRIVAGLLVGFGGMALLITARNPGQGLSGAINPAGVAALMLASLGWAGGSIYTRQMPKPESAMMSGALQMMSGGALLLVAGFFNGEIGSFDPSHVSTRSLVAFLCLTFVSSTLGFTAYTWLLKVSTPARVSTYAYVNPVVAIILGTTVGGEILTHRMLMAATVVLAGVVLILTPRRSAQSHPPRSTKFLSLEKAHDSLFSLSALGSVCLHIRRAIQGQYIRRDVKTNSMACATYLKDESRPASG